MSDSPDEAARLARWCGLMLSAALALTACASGGGAADAAGQGGELVGDPTRVPSRATLEASMVVVCEPRVEAARSLELSDAGWLSLLGEGEPLKWCAEPGEALGLTLEQLVSGARLCLEEHRTLQVAMWLSPRPGPGQADQGCAVVVETLSHQGRRWARVVGSPATEAVVEVYEVLEGDAVVRQYVGTPALDNHCAREDWVVAVGSEFGTGVSEALRAEWMVLPEVVRAFVCAGHL